MYFLLKIIAWILARFSPGSMVGLAQLITFIGYDCLRIRKSLILKNLNIAFKDELTKKEKQRIARSSFLNFVMTVLEFFRGRFIDMPDGVRFENAELMLKALDQGKGAFILCMHMGNWEAMGAAISRIIAPAYVIVKPVGSKNVDRFVEEIRKLNGFMSIKRTKGTHHIKHIFEALKHGDLVGFVMDQSRPGEDRIPFFGTGAKTNSGLAILARKTKAPVIPAYIRRERFGKHSIRFLEPLELKFTEDQAFDIKAMTTEFNKSLEAMIRLKPEQYFWLHDRWK